MTTQESTSVSEVGRQEEFFTSRRSDRFWEATNGVTMALPAIILLFTFLVLPFVMAIGWSFTNQRLFSPNEPKWVGLQNYEDLLSFSTLTLEPYTGDEPSRRQHIEIDGIWYPRVRNYTVDENSPVYDESLAGMQEWRSFKQPGSDNRIIILARDPVFLQALQNILIFVLIVVPGQGGLALVLALILNQKLRGINVFRTMYFMPVVISMVVVSFLWRFMYDGDNGMLNNILGGVTFGAFEGYDWLGNEKTALNAIIIMSIWQGVGFHMVIWLSGLQSIPTSLYEAASVAGANTWQKFRHVTWPGLRNTAVFVFVVITMQAFGLFTQIDTMTQGGPNDATQTMVFQAVERGFRRFDLSGASAISVVLFVLVLFITMIQRYLTRERA